MKIKYILILICALLGRMNEQIFGQSVVKNAYYITCSDVNNYFQSHSYLIKKLYTTTIEGGDGKYYSSEGSAFLLRDEGVPNNLYVDYMTSDTRYTYTSMIGYIKGEGPMAGNNGGSFSVDDPVYITNADEEDDVCIVDNTFYITYGVFYDNGNTPVLKGIDINENEISFSNVKFNSQAPEAIPIDYSKIVSLNDVLNSKSHAFRIEKKLIDGTTTYGNAVDFYFYDMPYIQNCSPSNIVCDQKNIILTGKYHSFSDSPNAFLQVSADKGTSWTTIDKKLTSSTTISYSDLYSTSDNLGKELWIRAKQTFHNIDRYSDHISVAFLPSAKVEIEAKPKKLRCNGDKLDTLILTCTSIPSTGVTVDGSSIPLLYTIKEYSTEPTQGDQISYKGKIWYYKTGITSEANLTNTNQLIITASNLHGLDLSANVLYVTSAHFNSTSANCSDTSNLYVEEPGLLTRSVSLNTLKKTSYSIATGTDVGNISVTFDGGTSPYYIKERWAGSVLSTYSSPVTSTPLDVTFHGKDTLSLRLTDANGCNVLNQKLTAIKPSDITITNGSTTDVSCIADDGVNNNGTVSWTIANGVPSYYVKLYKKGSTADTFKDSICTKTGNVTFSNLGNVN
jgi:hypothetical protein